MRDGYIAFSPARANQAATLSEAIPRLSEAVRALALSGPGPVFVGIGASLAAACAPVWTLRGRGIHSLRLAAGDHPLPFPPSRHPVVAVSQSGRSSETLAVLASVDPSLSLAVVNVVPSPIADAATRTLALGNIPDSYASTIGYTATAAALGLLADAWDGGVIDEGWPQLGDVVAKVEDDVRDQVMGLAPLFAYATSADFVGAGPSVGTAEASALLFREVARIPSTGLSTRQYLHGSMESAGGGVHVLFGGARELAIAHALATAGHQAILVTPDDIDGAPRVHPVRIPELPASQQAVVEIVVTQILVAAAAEVRGVDIEEFVFHNNDTKVPGA